MMQITEDTPPDMLAGAMDLSVYLPNGKAVKMSVERSTPMMDLLVQITTAHHLQLSNHTLQVLGVAPSPERSDRILPFKPNTPIGALDTQHIRVLPKGKTFPAPKYVAPGHQPFESTFRLKVHLPRNQLYVTRVSRHVFLEDIMKKVCEEKNLDPTKYDFKHPGNLDQVLDPKLTLSDYQITEIYVVAKGAASTSQVFSAADIMVLRKEEERKQMHNKTGGGVFNLIFKRGKSSMGSGSVSSDNRSISPTHSDDSRSVTPPAVPAPPIVAPPPPPERPKPPQRKRRPAPRPPQIQVVEAASNGVEEKSSSVVSSEAAGKKASENGLTICHSRNSSDSSGYHEASILSDHCANASLPRNRPRSAFVSDLASLQSTSNLTKMAVQSKSTTSLVAGRKKKAAPPPPPVEVSPTSSVVAQSDNPSPLVASQSDIATPPPEFPEVLETTPTNLTPIPRPRNKVPKALPRLRPDNISYNEEIEENRTPNNEYSMEEILTSLEAVKPFIMNTETPVLVAVDANEGGKSKPPEIVGMVPKTPKQDKKFSPNGFQSLKQAFDSETASLKSAESKSSRNSVGLEDEISDLDENMFSGSLSKKRPEAFNQLFGIHDYAPSTYRREISISSLTSSRGSFPGSSQDGLRKWDNSEDLDSISVVSCGVRNRWVAGDVSDTESVTSAQTPHDTIPPLPLEINAPAQQEEKSLDSTDSGIAQDASKEDAEEEFGFRTPPPPPVLDDVVVNSKAHTPPPPPTTAPPTKKEAELVDIDWQYQLPSPPKAFRDSSPSNLTLVNETNSVSDFKDSVVTSPELFEKLRKLEDNQSEPLRSEATSVASEEPLNMLSLEHLEKRKSLVYNRELATSLKMTDSIETSGKTAEPFASSQQKQPSKPARTTHHHMLPNFQITTYDVPKHKNIKVFEDDAVSSNTHGSKKELGSSMENISFTKRNSIDEREYTFYKPQPPQSVSRSGSFSIDPRLSPSKPVSRSKSTLTLNKYHAGGKRDETNMSKSSSLFDVSGLQSLEVMRIIQNKLNSPPNSTENISSIEDQPFEPEPPPPIPTEEKPQPAPEPVKKYYYKGPPSVNMSTWSERPKIPVAVKEDEDYKLGNVNSKLIVTTTETNRVEQQIEPQKSGNVIIKIGGTASNNNYIKSFVGPMGYRKPLGNVNGNPRPHSIALPSDFDISRVPIVKSVEFKKPFKESHGSNTSVTHLNQEKDDFSSLHHYYEKPDSFVEKFKSTENLRSIEKQESEPGKRVFRIGPIVRGFKSPNSNNDIINNRLSWNPSIANYNTLPAKPKKVPETTNQYVPFSQSTLRRTDSSRLYTVNDIEKPFNSLPPALINKTPSIPPPPPQMPKVTPRKVAVPQPSQSTSPTDARDMLLESIRNFGGKKGLKAVKS